MSRSKGKGVVKGEMGHSSGRRVRKTPTVYCFVISAYVCGLQAELSSVSPGLPFSRFSAENPLTINVRLVVLQEPQWTSSSIPLIL